MAKKISQDSEKQAVNKDTREQRGSGKMIGTPAIDYIKQIVAILKPYELSDSQKLRTYQSMLLDDAVFSVYDANCVFIEESFSNFKIKCDVNSEESKKARDFVAWNLKNLEKQTMRSIARSGAEMKRDGIAPFEKIFEKGYDEWATTPSGKPAWKLKRLNYINPLSLDQTQPFEVVDGSDIKNMRQKLSAFKNSNSLKTKLKRSKDGIVRIAMNKIALMTYGSTDSQPFGVSPFDACYTAWREKVFLQDATLTGVAKDFAGTPVLYIPSEILDTASGDPSSAEAKMVKQLQDAMAAMHTGDQTSMILPSDTMNEVTGAGNRKFEIKFLGVEGSGKQWDTVELIEQRRKAIYNVFGAANLIAADSSGGYNQIEGQSNIHAKYISRDCNVIAETFNQDILPQLFRLNEWKLKSSDMPVIEAGEVSKVSLDEFGKYIQRVGAIGMLPRTAEVINSILSTADIDYQVPDDISTKDLDDLLMDASTKAGQGMKEGLNSGTGKKTGSEGNSSDTNSDNAS